MTALTDRQSQVLAFIASEIARCGLPPSRREIGAHFGIRSVNAVREHLEALTRKGYLALDEKLARGMRIVALPDGMAAPARGLSPETYIVSNDALALRGVTTGDVIFVDPEAPVAIGDLAIASSDDGPVIAVVASLAHHHHSASTAPRRVVARYRALPFPSLEGSC